MGYIKNFIVTLVTTIIFITAIEIISPDKPIKKYIKFVLNLILVSVLLSPIVYLFTKGEGEIIDTIEKYEQYFYDGVDTSSSNLITDERQEAFKENLNKNCNNMLEEQFSDKDFDCEVIGTLDLDSMTYKIDRVSVGVKDNKVKLIEKITIDTSKSTEAMSTTDEIENSDEIISYLMEQLNISREKIEVYKMERSE